LDGAEIEEVDNFNVIMGNIPRICENQSGFFGLLHGLFTSSVKKITISTESVSISMKSMTSPFQLLFCTQLFGFPKLDIFDCLEDHPRKSLAWVLVGVWT